MGTITSMSQALLTAFGTALAPFFAYIPRIFGAIIVLLIGLFVGRLVGTLATKGLRAVKFDQIADRAGIDDFLRNAGVRLDPAGVVGQIARGGTVEQIGAVYATISTQSGSFKVPNAELGRQTILVAGGGQGSGAERTGASRQRS